MANELTDVGENLALAATFAVTPLTLALYTVAGSDAGPGTEVTGGGYARQTITMAAPSAGASSNTNAITFANMPACTVVEAAIYDGSGTPRFVWRIATASQTYAAGNTATVAVGAITVSIN